MYPPPETRVSRYVSAMLSRVSATFQFADSSHFVLWKPKMPIFFRPNNNTKNYTYLSSILNPNNLFKNESLHLQQTSRSGLDIWLDVFLSTLSASYTSAILSDPVLRTSRCLVDTRKRNSRHGASVELLHFPFHSFFIQYYQQNFKSIEYFTSPNSPKLPW